MNIVSNSDLTININVKQSDGVTAYDLTGASIRVAVYQMKEKVLQLFEDGEVTRVSESNGQIRVFMDRSNVGQADENKKLFAEVELTVTDINFSGSTGILKVNDIELGTITNSVF